jgi:hypothetical protein
MVYISMCVISQKTHLRMTVISCKSIANVSSHSDVIMAGENGVCLALYISVILMSMLPPYSSLHHQQGVGTPQEGIDTKFPVYSSDGGEIRNFSFWPNRPAWENIPWPPRANKMATHGSRTAIIKDRKVPSAYVCTAQ